MTVAVEIEEITPKRLLQIRESLNLSQSEFAELLGISIDTVQNWEQGRRGISPMAKKMIQRAVDKMVRRGV